MHGASPHHGGSRWRIGVREVREHRRENRGGERNNQCLRNGLNILKETFRCLLSKLPSLILDLITNVHGSSLFLLYLSTT